MPRPKGWTEAQLAKRDRIAKALREQGTEEGRSYAIATAAVERGRRKGGKGHG